MGKPKYLDFMSEKEKSAYFSSIRAKDKPSGGLSYVDKDKRNAIMGRVRAAKNATNKNLRSSAFGQEPTSDSPQ